MKRNRVITFYSYKGGVGRSLALANVGYTLAQRGHRVLLLDFDFEAPGLHEMEIFRRLSNREALVAARRNVEGTPLIEFSRRPSVGGAIGLLRLYKQRYEAGDVDASPEWKLEDFAIPADESLLSNGDVPVMGQLWLLPSGAVFDLERYRNELASFDTNLRIDGKERALDAWSDILARIWNMGFDRVLIDARTGLSDPFYLALDICDTVVLLGSFTRQNVKGLRAAWNLLQNTHDDPEKGERKTLIVGTPEPDVDSIRKKQWEIRLATEDWPDFPGYDLQLPYVSELALEEVNYALPAYIEDSRFGVRHYRQQAERLTDLIETAWNQKPEITRKIQPKPSNPFELLRSDYISIQELQQYFIDPGERIHRSLREFMPMVVTGARGSGKTMLARYFGYERRLAELGDTTRPTPADAEKYIGIYLRLDVDILNAFLTPARDKQLIYDELFSQFFDILVIKKALNALEEFGGICQWCNQQELFRDLFREFGLSNDIRKACQLKEFLEFLDGQLSEIRRYLRNPRKTEVPFLIQGNILLKLLADHLTAVSHSPFHNHFFSIIVDEFEHFADFQQRVVNTRIKQIRESDRVTYRIFIRHGGLKTTETLAGGQLIQPIHDFKFLHLDEERDFNEIETHFNNVANKYLERNTFFSHLGLTEIAKLFARLTPEEEARLIVGSRWDKPLLDWAIKSFPQDTVAIRDWFKDEPRLHTKVVAVVVMNQGRRATSSRTEKMPLNVLSEFRGDSEKSKEWVHNYGQGALFWLCALYKKNKAYAGLNTILLLSGNNIRTFLEFCRSITEDWLTELKEDETFDLPISVKIQAKSLSKCAENYRSLLRSLPCYSRELLNLADRLGRLFEYFNKTSTQSEPEINHFSLSPDAAFSSEAGKWKIWFDNAYSESVILRLTANKQKGDSDVRGDDWQLNPCYAPFYQYSPRRKKKLSPLNGKDLQILFSGSKEEYDVWFTERTSPKGHSRKAANLSLFDDSLD